jgi:hypothetical protein
MGVPVPEAPRKMAVSEYAKWYGVQPWMTKKMLNQAG